MEDIVKMIDNCSLCGDLPKLTCNSLQIGNSRILILGESPAKDGWITSGRAFYNTKGSLQATGKILQKLLDICNLKIDEVYFTECCKCIISDRSKLRNCMSNCRNILFKQIEHTPCDIILPMGQYPTEAILGTRVLKMKDFVGKEFSVVFGNETKLVIPIYHTSPANPLCYKGNVNIFEKINKILGS